MVKLALRAYVASDYCDNVPTEVIVDIRPQEMLDLIAKTEGLDNLSHIVFHDWHPEFTNTVLLEDDEYMRVLDDDRMFDEDDFVRMDGGWIDVYDHQVIWHSYIKHTDIRVSSEPVRKEQLEAWCQKTS